MCYRIHENKSQIKDHTGWRTGVPAQEINLKPYM